MTTWFTLQLEDRPGSLARVAKQIADRGGNIVEIVHHRLFFDVPVKQAEVDIVIERGPSLYGLEVKATATPTPGHASSLHKWLELSGGRGALACRVPGPRTLRPGIRAVPWHLSW